MADSPCRHMTFQEERCPNPRYRFRRVADRGNYARGIAMDEGPNVLDQQRHDVTCLEERRDLLEVRLEIGGIAVGVIVEIRDLHIRYIERSQGGQVTVVERSVVPRQEFFEFLSLSRFGHYDCVLVMSAIFPPKSLWITTEIKGSRFKLVGISLDLDDTKLQQFTNSTFVHCSYCHQKVQYHLAKTNFGLSVRNI